MLVFALNTSPAMAKQCGRLDRSIGKIHTFDGSLIEGRAANQSCRHFRSGVPAGKRDGCGHLCLQNLHCLSVEQFGVAAVSIGESNNLRSDHLAHEGLVSTTEKRAHAIMGQSQVCEGLRIEALAHAEKV
jgi:hypothetical protein